MYSNTEKSQSSTVVEGPESLTDRKSPTMPPDVQACSSADDSGQTIQPPSFKTRLNDAWWTLELVSMFLAVLAFIVWLVLMSQSHAWKVLAEESTLMGPFTYLPSMTGFLMSTLRITMLYPVSAAMGQLKWHYFRRPGSRPVTDLKAFDDASRGLFGSLKLLTSKNGGHSLSLGCFLIMGGFLLESMAQNAIRPNNREKWYNVTSDVPGAKLYDGQAVLPYAIHYDGALQMDLVGGSTDTLTASSSMQAAIYTAWSYYERISRPNITQINRLPVDCSEDACRWNNATTLAANYECQSAPTARDPNGFMYSTQANISTHHDVTGPDGLEAGKAALVLKSSARIPPESSFAGLANNPGVIMHMAGLAARNENGTTKYEATECILFWEVRLIIETMFNSTTDILENSSVMTTQFEDITVDDKGGNITISAPCVGTNSGEECRYSVSSTAHIGLQNFLVNNIAGLVLVKGERFISVPNTVIMSLLLSSMFVAYGDDNIAHQHLQPTLEYYLNNVVISIDEEIRTVSGGKFHGEVHVTEPFFDIHWNYALYPGLTLLFSMCFVFVTMWRTWGLPVWKTSPLPMLYHGFDRPVGGGQYDLTNLAWMTQVSKKTQVRLQDREDGVGLKLRVA